MLFGALLIIAVLSLLIFTVPFRWKGPLSLLLTGASAVAGIAIAVRTFAGRSAVAAASDGYFGMQSIVADNLSAFFIILTTIAAISVTIYAWGFLKEYEGRKSPTQISLHYICLLLLYISMIFVVCCRDAFGFLFAWELMTLSSFVLILFDGHLRQTRRAALNYLVLMHIGFVMLLVGFNMMSQAGLAASFDSLPEYFATNKPLPLFIVFLVGFGMKAGVFPLHLWLPEAHPAAPSHVSAFMSGVMIKMGIYGILRVMFSMSEGLMGAAIIVFVTGIVTGMWGVILAAIQNRIKRLLAYSSIENIGIILIALGASGIGYADGNTTLAICALSGALLHTFNHSLFKTVLFLGAGNLYSATHTDSLDKLGGIGKRMPVTATLFLVGTVAISALPPLNGFVSEFLIYFGFLDTVAAGTGGVLVSICGIVVLSLIGGMVLLAFTKLFGVTFLGNPRSRDAEHVKEQSVIKLSAFILPCAGILIVGLVPFLFTDYIFALASGTLGIEGVTELPRISGQVYGIAVTAIILIAVTAALLAYRHYTLRNRVTEKTPVWGCGFETHSHKLQYSGESFSEGLYGISTSLTKNSGRGDIIDKNEIFPSPHSYDIGHKDKISTLFSRWWVSLVKFIHLRVMRLNTGKINHYIMYAVFYIALIFLLSLTDII